MTWVQVPSMFRILATSLFLMTALVGELERPDPASPPPSTAPGPMVLAEDASHDVLLESIDIRRLEGSVVGASALEVRLITVGSTHRDAPALPHAESSSHYAFAAYLQLQRAIPAEASPATVRLVATAAPSLQGPVWTFSASATSGSVAANSPEAEPRPSPTWRPLRVLGEDAGRAIAWRFDLAELASHFPAELPAEGDWALSDAYATGTMRLGSLPDASLRWTAGPAYESLRQDRAPDSGHGDRFVVPAPAGSADGTRYRLVEDRFDDALLEGVDIRRLEAAVHDAEVLELTLTTQRVLPRGTYRETSPEFHFAEYFELAPTGEPGTRPEGQPVTIALRAVAYLTFGRPEWEFSAFATAGRDALQELERGTGAGPWVPIPLDASAEQNVIAWRLDLTDLADAFPGELPGGAAWTLSQPFADSRVIVESTSEATLYWLANAPHDRFRRDRAPDAGYGLSFAIHGSAGGTGAEAVASGEVPHPRGDEAASVASQSNAPNNEEALPQAEDGASPGRSVPALGPAAILLGLLASVALSSRRK